MSSTTERDEGCVSKDRELRIVIKAASTLCGACYRVSRSRGNLFCGVFGEVLKGDYWEPMRCADCLAAEVESELLLPGRMGGL